MYARLRDELEMRLATMDDITQLSHHNIVVNRAMKLARAEGLSQEQMLIAAVAWLAIHNDDLTQEALRNSQYAAVNPQLPR